MAILSVSRKTDIPTFYSEWFLNRLEAGEFCIRNNPYKPDAVSRVTFDKKDIDCICFWTKNPIPMLPKLDRLNGYNYYFQFTLTGYGKDMERNLPDKNDLIEAFRELSRKTGMAAGKRVVWRYDPIVFTKKYTMEWHLDTFEKIATKLAGFTNRCVISFVDLYAFAKENMYKNGIVPLQKTQTEIFEFCKRLVEIAKNQGMEVFSCAEAIDFVGAGVDLKHGSCIDKALIESIIGYPLKVGKDKGQRAACGCVESVDVGKYSTCSNGCAYCYACQKNDNAAQNVETYDVHSPLLCNSLKDTDIITERKLKSLKDYDGFYASNQLNLFE